MDRKTFYTQISEEDEKKNPRKTRTRTEERKTPADRADADVMPFFFCPVKARPKLNAGMKDGSQQNYYTLKASQH